MEKEETTMPSRNPQQAAEAVQEHVPSPERPETAPPTQDASTEIWPTPDDVAPKDPLPPHRHCPVCGRWFAVDDHGRIAVHDASFSGECLGSRETTDLTAKMSEKAEQQKRSRSRDA
jgi:hypothetical protein